MELTQEQRFKFRRRAELEAAARRSPQKQELEIPEPAEETTGQYLKRELSPKNVLSAAVRPPLRAAIELVGLPADATMGVWNTLSGQTNRMPSEVSMSLLDKATTKPTGAGAVAETVSSMLAGSRVPIPGVKAAPAQAPLQSGAQRSAAKVIKEAAGDEPTQRALSRALTQYKSQIPGDRPRVSEVLKGTAEGVPLQALERDVARLTDAKFGSAATNFARQDLANKENVKTFKEELGKEHRALREAALAKIKPIADRRGGLSSHTLLKQLDAAAADGRVQGSKIARKSYESVRREIVEITDDKGRIDPNALDQVRLTFGPALKLTYAKNSKNVNDRVFVKAQQTANDIIDTTIERAGGTGYRAAMSQYATGMRKVDDVVDRQKDRFKPVVPASSSIKTLVADETANPLDSFNILNRHVTAAKGGWRIFQRKLGPGVVNEVGKAFQSPERLGAMLDPANRQTVLTGLRRARQKYGPRVPGALAPLSTDQDYQEQ